MNRAIGCISSTAVTIGLMSWLIAAHADEPISAQPASTPVVLGVAELDTVTAGAVTVAGDADAMALGSRPYAATVTDAKTVVRGRGVVEQGFVDAMALAAGDLRYTSASTSAYGEGDKVISIGNDHTVETPKFTKAVSWDKVIVINPRGKGPSS